MCRREFVGWAGAGLGFAQTRRAARPNVLLVVIDDLGWSDLGCQGSSFYETPHIDRLADEGTRFTNAYANCPVCSPSRAALLTGRFPARVGFTGHITATGRHRHPANGRILPPDDYLFLRAEEVTLAEALRPGGYVSASVGKWHLGPHGFWPEAHGFDMNVAGYEHGAPPSYFYPCTNARQDWNTAIPTLKGGRPGEYLTDRLTSEAVAFLEQNHRQPFFLYLPHYAVHTPLQAPPPLVAKYKRKLETRFPVWPRLFQEAGYRTGLIGKWHLGEQDRFHPARHGYGYTAIFAGGNTGPADPELAIGGQVRQMRGFTVDILTDLALDFLRERKDQPFLLSVHYREPHASNAPDAMGRDRTWLPMANEDWLPFHEKDVVLPNPEYPDLDVPRLRRMMREYLASVASIDRNAGRLLRYLREQGLEQDTMVVFTSDNGMNMGHNGIWHKGNGRWILRSRQGSRPNMYDHSLRVPAVVRWPGRVPAGLRLVQTFTNLDWFPTLLSAAGLSVPRETAIRGRDAWPLLQGKRVAWDDSFYGEYRLYHGDTADLRVWRTPDWKLVRDFANPGRDELYHLRADPEETRNLIRSPDGGARRALAELRARLNARLSALGDPLAGQA